MGLRYGTCLAFCLACVSLCKARELVNLETEKTAVQAELGKLMRRRSTYDDVPLEEIEAVYKRPKSTIPPSDSKDWHSLEKRAVTAEDRSESEEMMNNLRRTLGASNMPYMDYDTSLEETPSSWVSRCNYDSTVNLGDNEFGFKYIKSGGTSVPEALKSGFKNYKLELSSSYLKRFGCDIALCSSVWYQRQLYKNVDLVMCIFKGVSMNDSSKEQYKTGEACTECNSGSYWCDYGLCRDNCLVYNSQCYCHPYCLNCASYNQESCTCQCASGFGGPRCETQYNEDATAPNCSTTARVPKVLTTISSGAGLGTSNALPPLLQFFIVTIVVALLKINV